MEPTPRKLNPKIYARTWQQIADALGVSVPTARTWAAKDGRLARLISLDARGTPHASRKALAAYAKDRAKLVPMRSAGRGAQ